MKLEYIVMKNENGIPGRWLVTYEFENMYEVVCERDKSRITHVGKNKVRWCVGGCVRSVNPALIYPNTFDTGY
jgi:hypothetical protein